MDKLKLILLVKKAAQGDQKAFEQWLGYTAPLVYRLSLSILGSYADAEEAVQESYVRAWRNLPSIRNHDKSLAWICRIARNVARSHYQKKKRNHFFSLDQSVNNQAGFILERFARREKDLESTIASAQERVLLNKAIETLSEKYRTVLLLSVVDNLNDNEIAVALGCSVGTVYSRLHRAKRILARKLRGRRAL